MSRWLRKPASLDFGSGLLSDFGFACCCCRTVRFDPALEKMNHSGSRNLFTHSSKILEYPRGQVAPRRNAHPLQHPIHVVLCFGLAILFLAHAPAWQLAAGLCSTLWPV